MELKHDSIIVSDRLQALFDFELKNYFTHVFVTDGECAMKYSGEEVRMEKGDCVIIIANHLVTELRPTENFRAKVIFIEPGFMEACTPHTSYGIVGGMTLFINPVMHLDERDQWLCKHDFDEVIRRIRKPHQSFQGDAVMAATQMMFCDFYEFHAHLYGQPEISALTSSLMKRFIDLLERGDYRRNRDVAYYADKLCVTPKYLSEVSKKLSGRTAGFWIDRYATIELTHLLRDKRLSLIDISDQFGFSSQSHFSRYVQKNLGVSPSDFRQ